MKHLKLSHIAKLFPKSHHEFVWIFSKFKYVANKRLGTREHRGEFGI
jgi:hypothetical protein